MDLQLFGDNPPTALFQITSFPGASTVPLAEDASQNGHGGSQDGHRYERDSLATIISISTTSLSPALSAVDKAKLRDSLISVITTSSDISKLILAEEGDEVEERGRTEASRVAEASLEKISELPVLSPIPLPRRQGIRPSTSPGPRTAERPALPVRTHSIPAPQPGQVPRMMTTTPPPFSNLVAPSALERPATAPPVSPLPSEFQARRRRAAKLSKFFGVEVNVVAEALPTELPPSGKTSMAQDGGACERPPHPQTSLMVAEARRRKFLGMDGGDAVEERDMSEVLDQLRKMKSF
jgi:hypothetical protein